MSCIRAGNLPFATGEKWAHDCYSRDPMPSIDRSALGPSVMAPASTILDLRFTGVFPKYHGHSLLDISIYPC